MFFSDTFRSSITFPSDDVESMSVKRGKSEDDDGVAIS